MITTSSFAQFNPYTDNTKMLSLGVGASSWGIPFLVSYEQPIADNITVGGSLSYQSRSKTYASYKYKHTLYGLNARGSYHFNELLNATDDWDFYAGVALGYYFWSSPDNYIGSGYGGFNASPLVGARYFLNQNLGFYGELGASSISTGATIGVTFLF